MVTAHSGIRHGSPHMASHGIGITEIIRCKDINWMTSAESRRAEYY